MENIKVNIVSVVLLEHHTNIQKPRALAPTHMHTHIIPIDILPVF